MAKPGGVSSGKSAVEDFGAWGGSSGPSPRAPSTPRPPHDYNTPGAFEFDVTTPQGLAQSFRSNVAEAVAYTDGLNSMLFGSHRVGTSQENQGGAPVTSDIGRAVGRIPFVGGIVGGAGDIIGGIGDTLKNTGDVVGGAFEQVQWNGPTFKAAADKQYAALPADARAKVEEMSVGKSDGEVQHIKFEAVREWMKTQQEVNPQLYPETAAIPVTLADSLSLALEIPSLFSRHTVRFAAGWEKADGLNRMEAIDAVMKGGVVFLPGLANSSIGASDTEKLAWTKWQSGEWSIDQSLDFLTAAHTGVSHDPLANIGAEVALDPTVWGSLGAAAFAKVGMVGLRLIVPGMELATIGKVSHGTLIQRVAATMTHVEPLSVKDGNALYKAVKVVLRAEEKLAPDLPQAAWDKVASEFGHGLKGEDIMVLFARAEAEARRIRPYDVLGRLAAGQRSTSAMRAIGGHAIGSVLQQQYLGRTAQVVHTIIDPFHAMSTGRASAEAATGLLSEAAPRLADEAFGHLASAEVLQDFHHWQPGLGLEDDAAYAVNVAREVATDNHIAAQFAAGPGAVEALHEGAAAARLEGRILVNDIADAATARAPRNVFDDLKTRFVEVLPTQWGAAERTNLAMRLHAAYSNHRIPDMPTSVAEWTTYLSGKSVGVLNKLHARTFANLSQRLMTAVEEGTREIGAAMAAELKLGRLYLMNRSTLTTAGAQGILDDLTRAAANVRDQVDIMRTAQRTYPELGFVPFREVAPGQSVAEWSRWLEREVAVGRYPVQLLDNEIAQLPEQIQEVDRLISGTYTLAYGPADEASNLMGLSRGANGSLGRAYSPWVGRVGAGAVKARGTFATSHNLIGLPIIGDKIGKPIDFIEAGLRTVTSMVSTEVISLRATQRFQTLAAERHSLSAIESKPIIAAIQDAAGLKQLTVRGMSATDMNMAVRKLLPRGSKMQPADILNLVLEAYEGDLRYVGLTQKLTGRAKVWLGKSGTNFAGQVSEDLYPRIRFKYNLVFQGQERIEPWVLAAQRGVMPAFGTTMDEQARFEARLAQNLRDSGLMRAASIDSAEWSSYVVAGSDIAAILGRTADPGLFAAIRDVRGVKFTSMNHVAAASSATKIRAVLDREMPGYFERLMAYDSERLGRLATEREVVAHWLNEGGLTHSLDIPDIIRPGDGVRAFQDHIRMGEMMRPVDLGEVRRIDLDFLAARIGVVDSDGNILRTESELRRALADPMSGVTDNTVHEALLEHGAHETQAARAVTALNFHWGTFNEALARRYNLTVEESRAIEEWLAGAAAMRGMTPVDFVSQVFSPTIAGGMEATIGNLGAAINVMRAGRPGVAPDLARLASVAVGGVPTSTSSDLMLQLAQVFSAHLDPSARWALLQAWRPELQQAVRDGTVSLDLRTLNEMWDQGGDNALAQALMHNVSAAVITDDAAEFSTRFPGWTRPTIVQDAESHVRLPDKVTGPLGAGLLAVPEAVQQPLVRRISTLRTTLPDIRIRFDVNHLHEADPVGIAADTAHGATYRLGARHTNQYQVNLESDMFGADSAERWAAREHLYAMGASRDSFPHLGGGPRQSYYGTPESIANGPEALVDHEVAHTVAQEVGRRSAEPAFDAIQTDLRNLQGSPAARQLSEMAVFNDKEGEAEFIAAALRADDPQFIAELRARSVIPATGAGAPASAADAIEAPVFASSSRGVANRNPLVRQFAAQFRVDDLAAATDPGSWEAEVQRVAESLGSDASRYTDAKFTKFAQDVRGEVAAQAHEDAAVSAASVAADPDIPAHLREVPPGPTNAADAVLKLREDLINAGMLQPIDQGAADVQRAAQMFGRFTTEVVRDGLLRGTDSPFASLLNDIARIPTHDAVPYNLTHGLLVQQVEGAMVRGSEDAFRLNFFAQNRSWAERSINHPFFGIYPASYMWGKIAPELAKFMMQSPFGVRTGAASYVARDMAHSIAMQQELNPEFAAMMEKVGHSDIGWFLGYALPALPWDVGGSLPTWTRDLSAQGAANQARVDAGLPPQPINLGSAIQKVQDYVSPGRQITQVRRPLDELGQIITSKADQKTAPARNFVPADAGEVSALDLGPTLADEMQTLQDMLSQR